MSRLRALAQVGRQHRMIPYGRITIMAQALLAIAFVAYLLINDGVRAPWAPSYEVRAVFDDAGGLNAKNEPHVSVAGVEVGEVKDVGYENGKAVVTMRLESRRARNLLRSDATADISPRSALNDLGVDLEPGRSRRPLGDHQLISARRTRSHVALDELVGVLDADTRSWTQVLLAEAETALRGRSGELAKGLRELGRLTEPSSEVAAALAERRRLLVRLVDEANVMFRALGDSGPELGEVVRAGRTTLDVTSERGAQLSGTMRLLPGTLAALDRALSEVDRLAVPLDPALERLRPFARTLPSGLAALDRFVPAGRSLIHDLGPLTRQGRVPARELRRALAALGPASRSLAPAVENVRTVAAAIDKNKAGIRPLGENFSGVFSTNDSNGPLLRGLGYFEAFRCENFGFSGEFFPTCGPPPAGSTAAARARARGLRPPEMVLAALLQLCHGGPRVAQNAVACLVIYQSSDMVRELPKLAATKRGTLELSRAKRVLAGILPQDGLRRLRAELTQLMPRRQVALITPASRGVNDGFLRPTASLRAAGKRAGRGG